MNLQKESYTPNRCNGVFKSVDGGKTWSSINSAYGADSLAIEPGSPHVIYAATNGKILKTSDEGAGWSDITPNLSVDTLLSGLTMDPSPQHILYANGNGGIWAYSTKPLDITVEMIAPYTATVGGPSFTLAVTGNGFGSDAVVLWNRSALATTYISQSQLMAAVPANLITAADLIDISVSSEGNTSANFGFAIRPLGVTAVPVVTTTAITNITQTSAIGGGIVTSDGGASVTARGICWSTSANPTMANICTSNGTGTGAFTGSITGLTADMSYHVRAYATNVVGTAYGSDVSFTTLALVPDFQVSTGSGGSYSSTVTAGSSAVYNLAVTGINGFSGSVNFACSGLPSKTTCSVSPMPLSVSGSAAVPFTVTIKTTAQTKVAGVTTDRSRFPLDRSAPAALLGLSALITMMCMPKRRLSVAFLMLCVVGIASCGGGSKKTTSSTTPGTPAGTYSIALAATSGSISHNANLTLTVQ